MDRDFELTCALSCPDFKRAHTILADAEAEIAQKRQALEEAGRVICWAISLVGADGADPSRVFHEALKIVAAALTGRDVPMFVILCARHGASEAFRWWKDGGNYTWDIRKAAVFTESEAAAKVRGIADVPVPIMRALAMSCPVVPFEADGAEDLRKAIREGS